MNLEIETTERKLSLRDIFDAYILWMFAAKNHWLNKTAEAEDFCLKCLTWTWGEGVRIDFQYENLAIQCHGPNGEYVLINEEEVNK